MEHGPLPPGRPRAAETPHPASPQRGRARQAASVLRGAHGRGGLLVRLVPAVPPGDPVRDRRLAGVGRPGRLHDAQPSAETAPPQAARALPQGDVVRDRRRHRAAPHPGQRRRPAVVRRVRRRLAALPQRDRRRDRLRRVRHRHGRDGLRDAVRAGGRLRRHPGVHHPPVAADRRPAAPRVRDRGERPCRAAEALPVALRPVP